MSAAYDQYDYISYWIGRDYEHKAEVLALRAFLKKIKKIKTILEVGAGFGRLAPTYSYRAKKVILSDPSGKTLKVARDTFSNKINFKYIHSSLENLPNKLRAKSVDVIVMIRVLHHIKDLNLAFKIIHRTLSDNGYLIFEFANKTHVKATIKNLFKGNFLFKSDRSTMDIRSRKSIKINALPFLNYHPDKISEILLTSGFEVIETRSVSNLRNSFLKKILVTDILVAIEKILQKPLSYFNFGPSIFVLAKKR
jgi:ubiquinone/menaquinone biosynthesis C-methylase UbiE